MHCLDEESLPLEAGFELASPVHCFLAYGLRSVPAIMSVVCCYIFLPYGLLALWNHKPDKPPSIGRLDHSVLGQRQKTDWYTRFLVSDISKINQSERKTQPYSPGLSPV